MLLVGINVTGFSALLINYLLRQPWLEPEKDQYETDITTFLALAAIFNGLGLMLPK